MRTFAIFLLLFALAAIVSGLLTYPAWVLVQTIADQPVHRVMERVGMLVLGATTVVFLRKWGLANKVALGYGISRPIFIRQMLWGFVSGVLLMLPITALLLSMGVRVLSADYLTSASPTLDLVKAVGVGLLTGFAVAFVEETFCRGAMFAAIKRESGLALAILLPTLFYAATHFLGGKLRIPADQVTYSSGLQVTANLFERFTSPLEFADSFLALVALGVLLSLIRWRTGAIAGCVGLHAGGVCVIVATRNLTDVDRSASWSWLVGSYDGVIGWLMLAWIAIVALVYLRFAKSDSYGHPVATN